MCELYVSTASTLTSNWGFIDRPQQFLKQESGCIVRFRAVFGSQTTSSHKIVMKLKIIRVCVQIYKCICVCTKD